jgi:hypothetical protein
MIIKLLVKSFSKHTSAARDVYFFHYFIFSLLLTLGDNNYCTSIGGEKLL